MLRVIAGSAGKLLLKTPEGLDTRPTSDRIKETLFNMIQADIYDSVVVDFFAGSGSLGIESLSRGARKAYFSDNSTKAHECIVDNLKHTHFEDKATVFKTDARSAASMINESHVDIIFMDPPYALNIESDMLNILKDKPYVDSDTLIIIEADLNNSFDWVESTGYDILKEKKYKTNKHVFLSLK